MRRGGTFGAASCKGASCGIALNLPLENQPMQTLEALERRRAELEAEIAEARQRLPAHSVKPIIMQMLLDLEDAYEQIMQEMAALKKRTLR
jgi:hypothetical protein